MYDRKTWIVLALCGGLLVAHLQFAGKQRQHELDQRKREQAVQARTAAADTAPARTPAAGLSVETPPPPAEEELFVMGNDRIEYTFTNIGGGLKFADFKEEFAVGSRSERVRANRFGGAPVLALAALDGTLQNLPHAVEEQVPGKRITYVAELPQGLKLRKSFSLIESKDPGAPYLLDVKVTLSNATAAPLPVSPWSLYLGEAAPLYPDEWPQQTGFFHRDGGEMDFTDSGKFKGGWFSSAKSMIRGKERSVDYAGVTNQFFATVLRPAAPYPASMWGTSKQVTLQGTAKPVTSVRAGLTLPGADIAPGESRETGYRLFIGPKHNQLLRKMDAHWGEGWGDVMQYGWFWFVSRPLNWLLNTYHNLLDGVARNWSWGLAIILLTITVRFAIWPLHAKSTHTMKRMAKLKPEMDKLREKYPDDPNRLNTEMMGLYRKYGINPLGGCLPMLIQIPIFFGFYRMLQYAVELRGKGFLWVDDLSQPDTLGHFAGIPLNLLPVVMAITSFLQIRMTPSTGDKMQQRIIMLMPFVFFFFCYNFASALALYWTTQNIFSIGQTWLMSKVPEPELKPVKGAGKSWMERMVERQAEVQRMQREGRGGAMRDVTPPAKKPRAPRTGG
jgi:YidC/Oxa1 family membrane protein insertase